MTRTIGEHGRGDGGWQLERSDAGNTGTMIRPADAEPMVVQARICDTTCQKPIIQSPVGTCDGLCKKDGDPYGAHSGQHLCNKCGYQW